MRSKHYPSMRFIADRLLSISRDLQRDYYTNNKLTRADKFYLSSIILELCQHCEAINYYAPQVLITEDNYPRVLADYADSFPY